MTPVTTMQKVFAGIFVMLAISVWLFMSISLSGGDSGKKYYTLISESVRGLAPSSLVCFNGIPVGKVAKVSNNFKLNKVRVDMVITDKDTMIFGDFKTDKGVKKGTRVRLVTSFVTNMQYIDMTGGYKSYPVLKSGSLIPQVKESNFDAITSNAEKITQKITRVLSGKNLKNIEGIIKNLNLILTNANKNIFHKEASIVAQVSTILSNIEKISGKETKKRLDKILDDLAQTTGRLDSWSSNASKGVKSILENMNKLILSLNKIVAQGEDNNIVALVSSLNELIRENKENINRLVLNMQKLPGTLSREVTFLSGRANNTLGNINYYIVKDLTTATKELKSTLKELRAILYILRAKPNALMWGSGVRGK